MSDQAELTLDPKPVKVVFTLKSDKEGDVAIYANGGIIAWFTVLDDKIMLEVTDADNTLFHEDEEDGYLAVVR